MVLGNADKVLKPLTFLVLPIHLLVWNLSGILGTFAGILQTVLLILLFVYGLEEVGLFGRR